MHAITPLAPADRLTAIIEALMNTVADEVVLNWIPIPMIKLFWRRPGALWATKEEAEKYDAITWVDPSDYD